MNDHKVQIKKLDENFVFLQNRYKLLPTGRVLIRINPKRVTKMRRKLKDLRLKLDNPANKITFNDILQVYKSWMGGYRKVMTHTTYTNLKELFYQLYQDELVRNNIELN